MDKSCQSSSSSSAADSNSSSSSRDQYLRHLNKLSQKITKPIIKKQPNFDPLPPPPPPQPQNPPPFNNNNNNNNNNQPQQNLQHQPPVYNINKNDFRDVVQKLTGSPAHDRISTPPPIQQPKPQSSRLQRIRPPPLPQITNRPPPLINIPPRPPAVNFNHHNFSSFNGRHSSTPLSPLPPFPTVHAPAESPISAYMRDLQNLVSTMDSKNNFSGFSPLPLPQTEQHQPPQNQHQQQQPVTAAAVQSLSPFQMPSSPGPFGCLNSQLSSYPLLSPGFLFSPNSGNLGFPQLPLSPTVPVPSPRWRDI